MERLYFSLANSVQSANSFSPLRTDQKSQAVNDWVGRVFDTEFVNMPTTGTGSAFDFRIMASPRALASSPRALASDGCLGCKWAPQVTRRYSG